MIIHDTFKNSPTFEMPGYVLDVSLLRRIDSAASEIVARTPEGSAQQVISRFMVTSSEPGRVERFNDLDVLVKFLEEEKCLALELTYRAEDHSRTVSIEFKENGRVSVSSFPLSDGELDIQKLSRELQKCDQEHPWIINTAIFRPYMRSIIVLSIFVLSLFLLANVGYYIYARNYGVDIDTALIPSGNQYFQSVEDALKSDDMRKKIDVLLARELREFTNVTEILDRQQRIVVYSLIAIAIVLIAFLVHKKISSLYPRSFFAFGHQVTALRRLERRREIWGVVIILGFIVNILAGLAIAFIS